MDKRIEMELMNDEEKQAIEMMEIIVDECKLENKREGYEGTYYDGDTPIPYKEYEIILNLSTKLQKENKELKSKTQIISPLYVKENYIPKLKIQELINKLEKDIENTKNKLNNGYCDYIRKARLKAFINKMN